MKILKPIFPQLNTSIFNQRTYERFRIYEARFARSLGKIRIALVIAILVIFSLQFASGILSSNIQASSGRDYDDNAVIYGGALSIGELASRISSGTDGRHNDIKTIFYTLGIYENEFSQNGNIDGADRQTLDGYVTKSGAVYVNGNPNPVATGVISAGRSYMDGSVRDVFGLPLWWRSPSVSFVPNQLSAFVHLVNGRFSYAVIKSCGNPIKVWGSPQISLQKQVRNVTRGGGWATQVEAKRGETVEFKVIYNVGDESLSNVWLYDTLKGNTASRQKSNREYLSDPFNLTPGWFHYYPSGIKIPTGYQDQRMLAWQAPGRAPRASGTATFQTKIKNNTPSGITIINDAACYADRVGVVFSNTVSIIIPSEPTPTYTYDFTISKTVSLNNSAYYKSVTTTPGQYVYYKIYVKNTGTGTLSNLIIKDTLPSKTTYVSGSTYLYNSQYPSGEKIQDGITQGGINVGNYSSGADCKVIFKVKLDDDFPRGTSGLRNIGVAKADQVDSQQDIADINVGYYIAQIVQSKSAFNVTQGKDATQVMARPGDLIRYTLVTQNTGNATEHGYIVRDDISDLFNYSSVTNTGSGTIEGNEIVYPARDIAPSARLEDTFEVTIKAATSWPTGGSLTMRNTYGSQEVVVPVGTVIKWKTAFNETQGVDATTTKAHPGDVIRYTLYTKNNGALTEKDFIVEDDITDILEYADIKDKNSGTLNNGIISWPATDIVAGETIARVFTVTVKSDSAWPAGGDMLMTNIYGNSVDVAVVALGIIPAVKGAATQGVKGLATTGTVLNIIFGTFILLSSIYLYFRERILLRLALLAK